MGGWILSHNVPIVVLRNAAQPHHREMEPLDMHYHATSPRRCSSLVGSTLLALAAAQSLWAGDVTGTLTLPEGAKSGVGKDGKPDEMSTAIVWIEGTDANPITAKVPEETMTISQKGTQFSPRFAVAVVGQKVDMPNDDNTAHNVFSKSPTKSFNLGVYPKGESKDITVEKAGRIDLQCSMHRNMSAIVYVVPNEHFAKVAEDGTFKLPELKPGTYTLKAFHKDCGEFSKEITVPEKGDATAAVEMTAKK
jgi:plastocyanin